MRTYYYLYQRFIGERANVRILIEFEAVSKEFQESLKPWIRRGIIDGRALGWSRQSSIEGTKKKV